ncbi:hypothetical protein TVAGG3_0619690 [Trichomonas vaginalis G3]|uniref:hypothetical protein n=1 Tax=Trichomonas vaginalis (strain ATCC PRA-98 / G3) TaxID=412133 RepID=UPI0021E56861|nr:hypothetical protein TVAGG3_0619690 [Trichomonas vaginalis G3]KAI5503805.1 hypothetical protein TVAGG3_0619690 [Trichomonas vaginalis G3]
MGNDKFILIFNGMHPIYISKKQDYIHLQIGVYDTDITPHLFPSSQIPELFEQVIVLISTCGFQTSSEKSTAAIFESLKTFKPDRVIYFYASTVPSLPNLPFAVHCINVSSPTSKNTTPYSIFYENHFSFLMIQQTSKNVNGYLSLILDRNVPLRSTTTIIVSSGLNLEWVSAPYEEICKRTRSITLSSSYFHSLNSIMCALSVSSAFRNNNSFCLQISTVLDDKTIYVANNYFRKASNDDEFNLSFNFYAFGMLYLRQTAVSYFSSKGIFDRRYQWNYNNIPCDDESQGFVKKLIKRFNCVISSNSPLNNAQKDYLLFSINNLGIPFISDVINNLIAPPNENYILLPPFIFYKSDSESEKQQQLDLLQGGTIIISEYLSSTDFEKLLNILSLQ